MVFSSLIFLFSYLPFILLGNYLWRNRTWQNVFLFIGSMYFYAWGEGERVFIMLASIVLNYFVGRALGAYRSSKTKRKFLTAGILANLAVLVFFKYTGFFVRILNQALELFHSDIAIEFAEQTLPLGISFYTFQSISYLIDVYRSENKAQKSFIDVGLYISLFPQLIAGPIVRYHDIAHQLEHRVSTVDKFAEGVRRFVIGLGKKVLIANNVAFCVDEIYALGPSEMTTPLIWVATMGYALQLYFDFSGYSDMAIGLGKMFGFDILENFNFPYISRSITEFWRRWHISLSNWFRDYLFIPLGGSRGGKFKTYRNLLIVFVTVGLWHGADWNYIIFGLYHGSFMILERIGLITWLERRNKAFQYLYTQLALMFAWVIFRIEDLGSSFEMIQCMLGFCADGSGFFTVSSLTTPLFWTVFVIGVLASTPLFRELPKRKVIANWKATPALSILFYVTVLFFCTVSLVNSTYNPFIYFRF